MLHVETSPGSATVPSGAASSASSSSLPFVFVHGGSGSTRSGRELLAALPARFRWWAVDLPGHGQSEWTGRYGIEEVGAALADWAEAELDGPAWWYGHSYGGQVVAAAAGRRPLAFAGLVLGDTPLAPHRMYRLLDRTSGQLRRWRHWCGKPEAELLGLLGAEPFGDRTFAEALGPRHPYLTAMAASLHRHDPRFIDALVDDREAVYASLAQAGEWLAAVPGPLVLLRGDPEVFALSTEEDADLVRSSGGVVRVVDGVGHGLHHFAPGQIARLLDEVIP